MLTLLWSERDRNMFRIPSLSPINSSLSKRPTHGFCYLLTHGFSLLPTHSVSLSVTPRFSFLPTHGFPNSRPTHGLPSSFVDPGFLLLTYPTGCVICNIVALTKHNKTRLFGLAAPLLVVPHFCIPDLRGTSPVEHHSFVSITYQE